MTTNGAYKIEKGVPLPPKMGGQRKFKSKYHWDVMEVGDSFFVAGKTVRSFGFHLAAKRTGFRFTCRDEPGGVRVWRIA